jgi:GrpB-like predicted nucleotidyltransferase (UPF0157 family)
MGMAVDMEHYGGGVIVVCNYDPAWVATFEHERTRLSSVLGAMVSTIEHVGSASGAGPGCQTDY